MKWRVYDYGTNEFIGVLERDKPLSPGNTLRLLEGGDYVVHSVTTIGVKGVVQNARCTVMEIEG